MNEPKEIDLPPHQWRSEREKPKEPIFGDGLPEALAYLIGLALMVSALYFVRHL